MVITGYKYSTSAQNFLIKGPFATKYGSTKDTEIKTLTKTSVRANII